MTGSLGKGTLGSGGKEGLFANLIRDTNKDYAAEVMGRFAKLSSRWLSNFGMTISAYDVSPSPNLLRIKDDLMEKAFSCFNKDIENVTIRLKDS